MLDFRLMQLDLRRSTLPFEGEKMCKAATEMQPAECEQGTIQLRSISKASAIEDASYHGQ